LKVHGSSNPLVSWLYNTWINDFNLFQSLPVNLMKRERYAMMMPSNNAEYHAGLDCRLAVLRDSDSILPRDLAMALPKGSPHLEEFNRAIRELKADGTVARLERKYWINK